MHIKFIAAGVGLFGLGAAFGWALTADRWEQKRNEEDQELVYLLKYNRSKVVELMNEKDALLRERETHTRVIKDAKLRSVSLDAEPGPGGGKILSVTPVEEDHGTEEVTLGLVKSPEGETAETDETGEDDEAPDEDPETTRANLQALIENYTNNPDDVDVFTTRAGRTLETNHTPPFVISREKYAWDEEEGDDYAKITLTYFPRERLLIDDDEEPVKDVPSMVGWRNLSQFGAESGDPDTVFIRNRQLATDFEVVRETEGTIPLHIKYGMGKEEFNTNKAAGVIKFREEDM